MNTLLFLLPLFSLLCFAPLVLAHPGHQSDGSDMLASMVHSFMTEGHVLFLFAIGVGFGLWIVARRVIRRFCITRVGR